MPADETDEDVQAAIACERCVWDPAVRGAPGGLAALLDIDFFEFGAAGQRWTRQEIVAAMTGEGLSAEAGVVIAVSDLAGVSLAAGLVLVTCTTDIQGRRCNRSSIWRKTPAGWRTCFHQSTLIPAE